MKWLILCLVTLYVRVHMPQGANIRSYDGLSQQVVSALITAEGHTFDYVTEAEFREAAKERPVPQEPIERKLARDTLKSPLATEKQRIDALILLLDL